MYAKQEQQMTWPNAWLPLIWLCLASPPLSQQGGAGKIAARIRLDFNLCGGLSFISLLSLTFTLLFSRHFYLQFFFFEGRRQSKSELTLHTHAPQRKRKWQAADGSVRFCCVFVCVVSASMLFMLTIQFKCHFSPSTLRFPHKFKASSLS